MSHPPECSQRANNWTWRVSNFDGCSRTIARSNDRILSYIHTTGDGTNFTDSAHCEQQSIQFIFIASFLHRVTHISLFVLFSRFLSTVLIRISCTLLAHPHIWFVGRTGNFHSIIVPKASGRKLFWEGGRFRSFYIMRHLPHTQVCGCSELWFRVTENIILVSTW